MKWKETSWISYCMSSVLIFTAGGGLFIVSFMVVEGVLGSPSSTSGLAVLVILPACVVGGVAGACFGVVYSVLGRISGARIFHARPAQFNRVVGGVVLGTAVVVPLVMQMGWNIHNRPRVMVDRGVLSAALMAEMEERVATFRASEDEERVWGEFYPCGTQCEVAYDEHSVRLRFSGVDREYRHNLRGHYYIRDMQCAALEDGKDGEGYVLVYATLRSTSGKAMCMVFDGTGACVYQRLVRVL
jgi:hypothetical protein